MFLRKVLFLSTVQAKVECCIGVVDRICSHGICYVVYKLPHRLLDSKKLRRNLSMYTGGDYHTLMIRLVLSYLRR